MEQSKFKAKDAETQNILEDIYRNGLGIPLVSDTAPDKDKIKPNVLTFHGADAYIKLPTGKVIRITGVEV